MPTQRAVPVLVQHTTIAIYESLPGGQAKFVDALKIARARLVEYGFLTPGSENGPASAIRLTAKGVSRNRKHLSDKGANRKNREFEKLYRRYEPKVTEGVKGRPVEGSEREAKAAK